MKNSIGVIILNYNNWQGTLETYASIASHCAVGEGACYEITYFIVDNGSCDNSFEKIQQYFDRLHIDMFPVAEEEIQCLNVNSGQVYAILLSQNYGYAIGNNIAAKLVRKAKIEYTLVVNNDILFIDDAISRMLSYANRDTSAAIISTLLRKKDGSIDYMCARKRLDFIDMLIVSTYLHRLKLFSKHLWKREILRSIDKMPDKIEVDLPSGSCMFLQSSLFEEIGYFDSNTFLCYEEDILYEKIKLLKRKNIVLTDSYVIHLGGDTMKKIKSAYLFEKIYIGMLYYFERYRGVPKIFIIAFYVRMRIVIFLMKIKNALLDF